VSQVDLGFSFQDRMMAKLHDRGRRRRTSVAASRARHSMHTFLPAVVAFSYGADL